MHPIVLKTRVDITGPNFWGFKGKLTFFPTLTSGWRWNVNPVCPIIEPSIVDNKQRRLRLSYYGKKLEIYEHLGILRWFGLCNLFIKSSSWFPYHGRSLEIWQAIKPFCEEDTSREIKWYTVKEAVRWEYPNLRNNQKAFTEIQPNTEKVLEMEVTCSYQGLGTRTILFSFPDREALEELCSFHNQGWPKYLFYFSKVASFFGWPHHQTATWVQEWGEKEVLHRFILHRAVDLLGALSLLCRDGLLAARIVSQCSGHKADIEAILKANNLLYRLK